MMMKFVATIVNIGWILMEIVPREIELIVILVIRILTVLLVEPIHTMKTQMERIILAVIIVKILVNIP